MKSTTESVVSAVSEIRAALLKSADIPADAAAELTAIDLIFYARGLTKIVDDPEGLPDFIRALAGGDEIYHPLDVLDVARADLIADEQADAAPQQNPQSEHGQVVLVLMGIMAVIALVSVVVSAFIGIAQASTGTFSENPSAMVDSIRAIPAPATVDQVNEATAVILGTLAATTNPVIAAEFEAEIQKNTHPLEKHGEEAIAVEECIQNNGKLLSWVNTTTGRIANLCQIPDGKYAGKYGLQILEEADESWVTSFVKNKMTKLDQVLQYLINAGYFPQP